MALVRNYRKEEPQTDAAPFKDYNQEIQVTVSVNSIAQKLYESLDANNPHRQMLTETIIDLGLKDSNLSYLYNSLNGFTNEINFKVGQQVYCNSDYYDREIKESVTVGNCEILEIDPYSQSKVRISTPGGHGMWVNHQLLEEPKYTAAEALETIA